MKPRKPKEERWYSIPPPLKESPEGTNKSGIFDVLKFNSTSGLGGNSIEERLAQIQILLFKISKSLSFISTVILVGLIYGFIVVLNNS